MRLAAVLLFPIVLLIGAVVAEGQNKQKVSGAELQEWFSKGFVNAGINEGNASVFLSINTSLDKQRQWYYLPSGANGFANGTARIDGDRLCSKWDYSVGEICSDVYRIGENQYETTGGPSGQDRVRWYIIR